MFQRIIGFHFFILYAIFGKVAFLIYKCVCHHQEETARSCKGGIRGI